MRRLRSSGGRPAGVRPRSLPAAPWHCAKRDSGEGAPGWSLPAGLGRTRTAKKRAVEKVPGRTGRPGSWLGLRGVAQLGRPRIYRG